MKLNLGGVHMSKPLCGRGVAAAFAGLVASMLLARSAAADPVKCKSAISRESAKFAQKKIKFLQICEDKKVIGKLPATTDCLSDLTTAANIQKAEDTFKKLIG